MILGVRFPGTRRRSSTQVIKGLNQIFTGSGGQICCFQVTKVGFPFSLVGRTRGYDDEKSPLQFALENNFGEKRVNLARLQASIKNIYS